MIRLHCDWDHDHIMAFGLSCWVYCFGSVDSQRFLKNNNLNIIFDLVFVKSELLTKTFSQEVCLQHVKIVCCFGKQDKDSILFYTISTAIISMIFIMLCITTFLVICCQQLYNWSIISLLSSDQQLTHTWRRSFSMQHQDTVLLGKMSRTNNRKLNEQIIKQNIRNKMYFANNNIKFYVKSFIAIVRTF